MQVVLTIAGSDSGGGAGIQADLKTFQELGVFGTCAITAVTAQNTKSVYSIMPVSTELVKDQIDAVMSDFKVSAIKVGMLFSTDIIHSVAQKLMNSESVTIIDPVMISKSGEHLLDRNALNKFKNDILPKCVLLTPNIPEAEALTGEVIKKEEDIVRVAGVLQSYGVENILIKGGHLPDSSFSKDYIFIDNQRYCLSSERIQTQNTHGTGCTFSAAITAFIAQKFSLLEAILEAKKYIQSAIKNDLHLGKGYGPVNHFAYKQNLPIGKIEINEF